jgi:hypothetical protein
VVLARAQFTPLYVEKKDLVGASENDSGHAGRDADLSGVARATTSCPAA